MAFINLSPIQVIGEMPSGAINGSNVVFTTAFDFVGGTEQVYFNGVRQLEGAGSDYVRSESGGPTTGFDTLTFSNSPRGAIGSKPAEKIMVDYERS